MINFADYTKAKVLVHWMPWWGHPSHLSLKYTLTNGDVVPYDERNNVILDDQVVKMGAAGIVGVNADYYGPESYEGLTSLKMLSACERGGIGFSLCIDQGSMHGLTGAAATNEYIRIMNFVADAFFTNPAYISIGGKYLLTFFGEPVGVDWNAIRNGVKSPMLWLFQDGGGFTHTQSDGAFGWVHPTTPANNWNQVSVQSFVSAASSNAAKLAVYPVYTGFDDGAASWGLNRFMSRRVGKTLTDTLSQVPATAQYAMVATWNDHEEATNIEEGVHA